MPFTLLANATKMDGYYRLSVLMGTYPDLAIFRTFKTAHALNLLVLEAEINNLQQALGTEAKKQRDAEVTHQERKPLDESVTALIDDWRDNPDPDRPTQYGGILRLRELLKTYGSSIISTHTLSSLSRDLTVRR